MKDPCGARLYVTVAKLLLPVFLYTAETLLHNSIEHSEFYNAMLRFKSRHVCRLKAKATSRHESSVPSLATLLCTPRPYQVNAVYSLPQRPMCCCVDLSCNQSCLSTCLVQLPILTFDPLHQQYILMLKLTSRSG